MNISRTLLCLPLVAVTAIAGCSDADTSEVASTVAPLTSGDVLARAQEWVDRRVPYCGGSNGGSDSLCGGTCRRAGAAWDAWRSDCSGFVSWTWHLPAPGFTTHVFMNDRGGPSGWTTVPVDALQPGDAIVTDEHIKLFSRFIDASTMEIYEESDCGLVAMRRNQGFRRSGARSLVFTGDGRVFHAIHSNGTSGGGSSPSPSPSPSPSGNCGVHGGKLTCPNTPGAAIHSGTSSSSAVVDHLRTTTSWFDCWAMGATHAGGNNTWYHTQGDDRGVWGWVAAVDLQTPDALDANPAAAGLAACR